MMVNREKYGFTDKIRLPLIRGNKILLALIDLRGLKFFAYNKLEYQLKTKYNILASPIDTGIIEWSS